ncbi:NB-ARC domain-containing protein [Argonema galeatum]|uniref:NB-ARC domain-containing protein n=1 Tax=Argonema galeatum TaxID=2942762 RepID=UPI0020113A6C|nr:NB-ARC domain-containing protein [Argonema galeatum]MCL1466829.1 NACHT domain-containing protein [Argonema galeatum A003/A1]
MSSQYIRMPTLKASQQGLAKIRQARTKRGWPVSDRKWLEEASLVLGINWENKGYLADGISEGTWSRFLAGKCPINTDAFHAYCEVLGLNWEDIVDRDRVRCQDWDSAPDVSVFYGRLEELATLEEWIVKNRCRLIALVGMGGIGKTSLAAKIAAQIQDEFEFLIWRSLHDAPSIEHLLYDLIQFLSNQQKTELNSSFEGSVSHLIDCLQKHRCLLILDNWEPVLGTCKMAGQYRKGYEVYGELIKRVGESQHHSCLVLTSREKPGVIAALEGPNLLVRSLKLTGLGEATRDILKEKGLHEENLWSELIQPYRGNPLALKIVAATIHDLFGGSISDFLMQNTLFLGDFEYLLYQQFHRLSELEKELMYGISMSLTSRTISQLRSNIQEEISSSQLIKALESLERKSLIEKVKEENETSFTLQPMVMKYVKTHYSRC